MLFITRVVQTFVMILDERPVDRFSSKDVRVDRQMAE